MADRVLRDGTNTTVDVSAAGFIEVDSGPRTIGTQAGATYTLAAGDCYTYLRLTNASPDLTVPDDGDVTWPVGGWVEIFAPAGPITFIEDTAVTINVAAGQSLIGEDAGSGFTLIKVAANTWDLVGRLAAP